MSVQQEHPTNFCPYRGLEPYDEKYREYFFGRERDQRAIISNLHAMPVTILYGMSGVGKSSVLLAGVVPQLKETEHLAVVIFRKWQDEGFVTALKTEILRAVGEKLQQNVKVDLNLPFDQFLHACSQQLQGSIFIILDQFEEFFLYHPPSSAPDSFDADFARAVNRRGLDVRFLISMRQEELSKLDRFRGRIPNLLGNMLRLRHLSPNAARAAIISPLKKYNENFKPSTPVQIEPALVDALLTAAVNATADGDEVSASAGEDGALKVSLQEGEEELETPVLQMLLVRLWEEEKREGSSLLRLDTFTNAEKLGGTKNIVRRYVEDALSQLTPQDQRIAADLFRFLVTSARSKIAQDADALAEFTGHDVERVRSVLERLYVHRDMRLLRKVRLRGRDDMYEIFHDVLAQPLLNWRLRQEEQQKRERERAEAKRERQLEQARYMRWAMAGMTLVLLAVSGLGVYAYWQRGRAETARVVAESARAEAERERERAKSEESKAIAEQAKTLTALGQAKKAEQEAREAQEITKQERDRAEKNARIAEEQRKKAEANLREANLEKVRANQAELQSARATAVAAATALKNFEDHLVNNDMLLKPAAIAQLQGIVEALEKDSDLGPFLQRAGLSSTETNGTKLLDGLVEIRRSLASSNNIPLLSKIDLTISGVNKRNVVRIPGSISLKELELNCENAEDGKLAKLVRLELGVRTGSLGITNATYEARDNRERGGDLTIKEYTDEAEAQSQITYQHTKGETFLFRGEAYIQNKAVKVLVFRSGQ